MRFQVLFDLRQMKKQEKAVGLPGRRYAVGFREVSAADGRSNREESDQGVFVFASTVRNVTSYERTLIHSWDLV